jgi:hypothetical protein
MISTATGLALLVKALSDCKEAINEVNQACISKGLPPAFYIPQGSAFVRGNKDYSFQGFGMDVSVIPPQMSLTFWVHYRIDSDDHVELGKFACPLKALDMSALKVLNNLDVVPFEELRFDQGIEDANELSPGESPREYGEEAVINNSAELPSDILEEDVIGIEQTPDEENFILRATQNTVLKISCVPSPDLSDDEKVNFSAQSTVPLSSFQDQNDHLKVTLANTTLGGRKTWVAYKEHVEV